jgi:hypothetical protein
MPVILTTWNVEIERMMVQGQLRQKKLVRLHLIQWLGAMVDTCHPSYGGEIKIGGPQFRLTWAKTECPSPTRAKKHRQLGSRGRTLAYQMLNP